jgi:NADPH2:quinone reductase
MRAAVVHDLAGIDALTVEEVDDPVARAGEVVVDVAAAAVNFADILITQGRYQMRPEPPFTPGSEFAGVVREAAPGLDLAPGDRVFGATLVGAFAERVVVPASALAPVPDGVPLAEAAAFMVAYGTSYHSLRSVAQLDAGEELVVLGAAGGVGLAAVEIGVLLGARVTACASSDAKLAVCREHGAAATVDYTRGDLKTAIRDATGGGAHVVLDPVGGPYSEPALRATRYGGRFVTVGFAAGEIPRIPLNLVLLKGVDVRGFEIWSFMQHRPGDARRDRDELLGHLSSGALRPHVSATFPLDDVAEALRTVEQRRAAGKVVVAP